MQNVMGSRDDIITYFVLKKNAEVDNLVSNKRNMGLCFEVTKNVIKKIFFCGGTKGRIMYN